MCIPSRYDGRGTTYERARIVGRRSRSSSPPATRGHRFVSGYWAVLIALGPAAYLFVLDAHNPDNAPQMIVISYIAALVTGWVAYIVIAEGVAPIAVEPMSQEGLRIVVSVIVAFAIMTGIFYVFDTHQPMAYVATSMAALGGLPTFQSIVVAIAAVVVLAGLQMIRRRYGPEFTPSASLTGEQSFQL